MAHIAYVWELGANFGHLGSFSPIADELHRRGHQVSLIAKKVDGYHLFFDRSRVRVFQGPLAAGRAPARFVPRTWSEIVGYSGFSSGDSLADLLTSWRHLFETLAPDVVALNFAAVSSLAARTLGLRTASLGVGYAIPPHVAPLPELQPLAKIPDAQRHSLDDKVLSVANEALETLGLESIESVVDIFAADRELLCSFKELDHYPAREGGRYFGASFELDGGVDPKWPAAPGKKVFAYARPGGPHFQNLIQGLAGCGLPALLVCPGAPPDFVKKFSSPTFKIETRPVSIRRAREQAELMVCPGGQGTLAAFLLAGVPVLAAPDHQEQSIQAGVAQMSQSGVATLPLQGDCAALLRAAANDGDLKAQAQSFRERYSDFSMEAQARVIADELEACALGRKAPMTPTVSAWRHSG